MHTLTKFTIGVVAVFALSFTAVGIASGPDAEAQAEGQAITITDFQYEPAELAAKVGQPITITNNDVTPHTVTARDGSFDVEVPANGTATLTVPAPGNFPYYCTLHPNEHNPASINAS